MWIEGVNNAGVDARLRLRGERGSPHPQVGLDVALVAEGHGPPVKALHQEGTAVSWIRVADYNLEFLFEIIINARRSCPACRVATVGGQALGRRASASRRHDKLCQRGARARRVVAEYQPGYDGLPGGAQGLRALRFDYDYD